MWELLIKKSQRISTKLGIRKEVLDFLAQEKNNMSTSESIV